jgi:HEAT repeat protein
MGCGNAIKSLARMARDSRASVKREVVEALETHGNVGAAKALQVLANDTDDSVRQAAMAALERIEDEML